MIRINKGWLLLAAAFSFYNVSAQDVALKDLRTPNSPGFQILDISPSNIERPTNPKAFALGVLNLSTQGSVIPKNFSFELSPYWYFKPQNATVYKYLNIQGPDSNRHVFSGILNKLSVSLASSFIDSSSGSVFKNTNYVSAGIRTNLITLRSAGQHARNRAAVAGIAARMKAFGDNSRAAKGQLKILFVQYEDSARRAISEIAKAEMKAKSLQVQAEIDKLDAAWPATLEGLMDNDAAVQEYFTSLEEAPLFQLNVAYAYSSAFPDNMYKSKRFNRSGLWLDAALSGAGLTTKLKAFSLIASARFMTDNVLTDTARFVFDRKNALDVGGRLEYSLERFSIGIEYLKRSYSGAGEYNSERTVGVIQYKVSDNLFITGTYGKNFGNVKNLFTLLGVNWGMGKSTVRVED
ncbi:hypothetical protein HNQ91_001720 [Filimonas zeae]|uniref:DUF5723 domain-containing protein n=1 Tax=Filimonas zeae TaxID=1737353 RepID=A0A917MVS1_9BACT|nr:hypothetical protein [Filimonas zeae]MDR6338669.1 hypothetical protein [Filimonas zeae]GGH67142.1 hypothetical protein GCM10011379_22080 [Filimonas zeae]